MGFKAVLKGAFPFISVAAGLGGPLGAMAANAVGKALGVENVDPTADGIGAAITAAQVKDPDALLRLQQAEDAFKLQMAQLGVDSAEKLAELDNEDRASARNREIAVKDRTPAILAIAVTIGFFGMLTILAFVPTQATAHDILVGMTGSLGAAWLSVIGYYFGSSSGSAAKTQIIAAQNQAVK